MLGLSHETLVRTANELPPLPQAVTRLNELFADPNYAVREVSRAVELDPILAGRLLRIANSAIYGPGRVGAVNEAIVRVGGGTVKSLAIASSVRPAADLNLEPFGLTPASYWKHCVAVLSFAEELASRRIARFGGDFSTAALLHDFGKLVLAKHLQPEHIDALQCFGPEVRAVDREMAVLGVTHAEVSAVVIQAWNLPDTLVYATQHHHNPEMSDTMICHGLNVANQLTWRLEERRFDLAAESERFDASIQTLGLTPEVLQSVFESGTVRLQESLDVYS